MTMYGYLWLCLTMYDYVGICMNINDYVWLYMRGREKEKDRKRARAISKLFHSFKLLKIFKQFKPRLCLPLFTFVHMTHLCTNFVLVKYFLTQPLVKRVTKDSKDRLAT